jgi:hypothetical protein
MALTLPPLLIDPTLFPTADYWHTGARSGPKASGFKEWSHFSILGPDFDLLVNFSLMAGGRTGSESTAVMTPRLTVLFGGFDGTWDGAVESFGPDQTTVIAGLSDVVFDRNSARFIGHRYRLEASLAERDLCVELDLHPMTRPVIANNVRLSDAESVRWMVVPHLRASGEVTVAGRRYQVADAPAYHDRNWGCFAWGGAYAWEWATVLPNDVDQPWCLVYSRIVNRHRGATLSQSLILWRCESPSRKFYGRDLSVSHHGILRRDRALRLPRVASLLLPGTAADVPQQVVVSAQGYGDQITVRMAFDDYAQVVVPNDRWPGFTSLCEIRGHAEVTGKVGDRHIDFDGRVQAELNHAAG